MNSLERYLQQATRGLWGRKRLEVREELEAHILERARAFEVGGLTRLEAVEKVLAELGKPQAVSAGMVRLHTWPKVGFLASAMGLMAASLLIVQAQNYEVVPSQRLPTPSCIGVPESPFGCRTFNMAWIRFEDVQKALEPQGVKFDLEAGLYTLTFPERDQKITWTSGYQGTINGEQPLPNFLSAHELIIRVASRTNLSVRLEGWERPRIWFGEKIRFDLSVPGRLDLAHGLYSYLLFQQPGIFQRLAVGGNVLSFFNISPSKRSLSFDRISTSAVIWYPHRVKVEGASGKVWGVVMPSSFKSLNDTFSVFADVAPAKDGFVELYLPEAEVRFVGSFAETERSAVGISKAALVDLSKPYTKDGWSKAIVVPQNPISKAVQ